MIKKAFYIPETMPRLQAHECDKFPVLRALTVHKDKGSKQVVIMTLIQLTGTKVRKIQGDRHGAFPEAPADPREVKGSSPEHAMAKLRSDK